MLFSLFIGPPFVSPSAVGLGVDSLGFWVHFWKLLGLFKPLILLSNEKNTGWLNYIGDEILQSYTGNIINHYKDPLIIKPYFMESRRFFFRGSSGHYSMILKDPRHPGEYLFSFGCLIGILWGVQSYLHTKCMDVYRGKGILGI